MNNHNRNKEELLINNKKGVKRQRKDASTQTKNTQY